MNKKIRFIWILITIVPIVLLISGYLFPSAFFSNQEIIKEFVQSFGILAPIAFITLQVLQVVVTPFSHYTVSIAGGFLFGTWFGFLYNWIGRVIGTVIAFYIGRTFGRRLIEYIFDDKTLHKYDFYFNKSIVLLFLAYFLPFFPDDELSYLAGASKISKSAFIIIMTLGHMGGSLALAYVGNGIQSFKEPLFIILSSTTLLFGIFFGIFYLKIKKPIKKSTEFFTFNEPQKTHIFKKKKGS